LFTVQSNVKQQGEKRKKRYQSSNLSYKQQFVRTPHHIANQQHQQQQKLLSLQRTKDKDSMGAYPRLIMNPTLYLNLSIALFSRVLLDIGKKLYKKKERSLKKKERRRKEVVFASFGQKQKTKNDLKASFPGIGKFSPFADQGKG